jgi:DNA-binding IclR family transcriptional regulator
LSDLGIPLAGGSLERSPASLPPSPRLKLVPALEHAVAVVNFLNEHAAEAASLAEISGTLKITKSHCRSILMTLVHAGWARFDERTKTYQLHSGLLASGSSLLASPVLTRIRERLDNLVKRTGYSCVLTQPQADDSFVVIENFTATRQMEVSHPIGFHFPKDAPAQMRAHIAWQGDERLHRWIEGWTPNAYTATSIVTPEALIREVETTRKRGYSRSVGEHFESMMAFGLPIFGRSGEVSYVFCVMGFLNDLRKHEREVTDLMRKTVRDIHHATMAKPPEQFLPDAR